MAPIPPKGNTANPSKAKENLSDIAIGAEAQSHVGDVLRQARTERGLTLDMVADELMIRRFYLEALENGAFHDLPERVYATGFVRNYATYLGIDAAQLTEQFRRDAYGTRSTNYQVELMMPEPIIHSVVPGRAAIIAACVVLAVIVGIIVFMTRDKSSPAPVIPSPPSVSSENAQAVATNVATNMVAAEPGPQLSSETVPPANDAATQFVAAPNAATTNPVSGAVEPGASSAPVAVDAALATPTVSAALPSATTTTSPPAPAAKGVALEATESAWVEIKNATGGILFTNILKTGQMLPLPDEALTITTGNAGGLRIVMDGRPVKALGEPDEVKRNFPFDPRTLRQP